MTNVPRCKSCGRFFSMESGVAWRMVFSGVILMPDHEIFRCRPCVEKYGPFEAQSGVVPEHSCGIYK
jgi:hypothetical protein